jgi:predicted enzyme related to lactoylglutathione lyase
MGNPIVHWELIVGDLTKASEFYSKVFDWKIEDNPAFPGYPMIDPGKEPRGAMMAKPESAPACTITTYFGVEDIEQTIAQAVALGATVLVQPMSIEGVGQWAMFADPDGIPVGLFQAV